MAASTVHEIVDEKRWLQLGLGAGDETLEDSDEENENDPTVVPTLTLTLTYTALLIASHRILSCRVRLAVGRTSSLRSN